MTQWHSNGRSRVEIFFKLIFKYKSTSRFFKNYNNNSIIKKMGDIQVKFGL